ncbi:hypothetical protein [Streptomyces sp. NPDC055058]
MRVSFDQQADPGATFAPDAFVGAIGTLQTVRIKGRWYEAPLTDAKVSADGTTATLTIDLPDDALPQRAYPPGSFGYA